MRTADLVTLPLVVLLGCSGRNVPAEPAQAPAAQNDPAPAKPPAGNIDIQGAGATFPYPLYSKWVTEYQKSNPRVRINYQSIGSGGGIRQILERTVDFGASDAPMNAEELAKAPGKLLHIPMTLGAVVLAHTLPNVPDLRLS